MAASRVVVRLRGAVVGVVVVLVFLRPPLAPALAQLHHLARRRKAQVLRLVAGGRSDLLGHGLCRLLGELGPGQGVRRRKVPVLSASVLFRLPCGPAGGLADLAGGLAGSSDRLAGGLADLARGVTGTPDRLAGALTDTADRLAGALTDTADRLAGAFAELAGGLADTARGLTHTLAEPADSLSGALAEIADGLAEPARELVHVADRLPCAFAYVADGLARALADLTDSLACAFAYVADGLARALADLTDRLARALADLTDRLARALANLADGLARALSDLADGIAGALAKHRKRLPGALADLLDCLAGLAHHVTGSSADVLDRLTEAVDELRVAVDGGHDAIDDRGHVVEADLEQCLRLDALDVDLELAQVDVHSDVQGDQVENLCLERHMGVEVGELEVDLVDLEHRDVEQHVRGLSGLGEWGGGIIAVLALGHGRLALDVLREAVLLGLLRRGPPP